ncbi:MAG: low-specificity L-threonine aldolase [Erysipelotrichaceae bacterium]|nr:low-specificity L-threonine aldolase [Erysipelotrichaceae bacterium]
MKYIDLRSDTVTMPTPKMRQAMAQAEVGDDVYRDDPTVKELEVLAARVTGHQAGLFVASGTMGNQLAIMTHTRRGDEIITGSNYHIVAHEVGAAAVLSNVSIRMIQHDNDLIYPQDIKAAVRSTDIHNPTTSLLSLENALSNGTVMPKDLMLENIDTAHSLGLKVHLDGARVFNAAVALDCDVKELTAPFDSVMFCLSKGLCSPIGSMLVGSTEFIERARKNRKLLGGGMRQAGILAAAGLISIHEMTKRLVDDHENAKKLASMLSDVKEADVFEQLRDINMVYFKLNVEHPEKLVDFAMTQGCKINPPGHGVFRVVTHNDISLNDIEAFVQIVKLFMKENPSAIT